MLPPTTKFNMSGFDPAATRAHRLRAGSGGFGGFVPGGSQGDGSPGSKNRSDKNTVRPVTVRQIVDAYQAHPDAEFQIDGTDISQVSFVAKVLNLTKGSTNVSYVVEDGTAQVEVRQWTDQSDEADAQDEITQDSLVRVVGQLKAYHAKRHINASQVRPVTDPNEQQFHFLETIYVHLYHTKGPLASAAQASSYGGASTGQISHAPTNTNNLYNDLPQAQRKIMQYISSLGATDQLPMDGIHIQAIARSTGIDFNDVKEHVESLIGDGQLYTTTDEDHVMSTAS